MLDSLQRISAQSAQIARLTQQMALMQEAATAPSRHPPRDAPGAPSTPASVAAPGSAAVAPPRQVGLLGQILLAAWLIVCFATYVVQGYGTLPARLHNLLLAAYKE